MVLKYTALCQQAQAEIIEKKSKFIAGAAPVVSEEEALFFIENSKKKHRDASHNVFAYRIAPENTLERFSDDGEPSGTAGMPVLEVLRKEKLINVVVVVTRYFGGTLLGAGGLVRAYGSACKKALDTAGTGNMILYQPLEVTVDYGMSGKIQHAADSADFFITDTLYTDKVTFEILVEPGNVEKIKILMMDLSAGQAVLSPLEPVFRFSGF